MKNSIYILVLGILTLASCSLKEEFPSKNGQDGCVEFVVRPSSFNVCNVSSPQTKSAYTDPAYTGDQLTALEKKIVNAYFLIFRPDGQLYQAADQLTVTNSVITEYPKIKADALNADITACFIANVPESYINSIENINDLSTKPLPLEYASYESTGYVGIPSLNGTPCFPMFGMYIGPLTTDKPQVQISLKRLFAKVQVDLSMDMYENGLDPILEALGLPTGGLSNTYFNLKELTVTNLPRKVILAPLEDSNQESPWATTDTEDNVDDFFLSPQTVEVMQEVWDIRSVEAGVNTSFSFTCYVPEYALIPTESNNNQANKAALYNKDTQHPVHISLSGLFRRYDNTNAEVTYNIFLGENNSDSFSLFRNNFYKNNVVLDGSGHLNFGADNRVQKHPLNLVEVYGESSNCYIITVDGDYVIDTYAGAFSNIAANTPKVTGTPEAWSDGNNTVSCKLDEEDPTKIIVSISPKSGASAIAEGNAVISIPDGWSWHLWIVPASDNDQLFNAFLGTLQEQTYEVTNAVALNRNLGAASPTDAGAYYKWGAKEPFFNGAYKGVVTTASTWAGDGKQTTDPCPPGYKVPSTPIWMSYSDWEETTASQLGGVLSLLGSDYFTYGLSLSEYIRYPYSYYILSNGTMSENTSEYVPFQEGKTYQVTGMGREGSITYSFLGQSVSVPKLARDLFTITKMNILVSNKEGRIWCSSSGNPGYFYYTHKSLDISTIQDEEGLNEIVQIVEFRHQRQIVEGYSINLRNIREVIKAVANGNLTDAFLEGLASGWTPLTDVSNPTMTSNDKLSLMAKLLRDISDVNITNFETTTESVNQAEGLQVRCVKE